VSMLCSNFLLQAASISYFWGSIFPFIESVQLAVSVSVSHVSDEMRWMITNLYIQIFLCLP
jgi:hypothetical protein